MAYYPYGTGPITDLRRAGLALGAKAIDDLLLQPRLLERQKEAAMQKAAAVALLGGLATAPPGPEHVAGGEALKRLGIDLPLINVEQKVPQSVSDYETAKKVTVPPSADFTPPPVTQLLPKLAGISPGSLDQLITMLGTKEGMTATQLGDIKNTGLGLLERIMLAGAPKYGADRDMAIKEDKLSIDKLNATINAMRAELAKTAEDRQAKEGEATEKDRIRQRALDLQQEMDVTKDPSSAANAYAQLTQLHKQYPDVVTRPQFPERFDSAWANVKKGVFGTPTPRDKAEAAAREATTMKFPRRVQLGDGSIVTVNTQEEYDKIFKGK